jgi:hypothetical protein
MTHFGVSLTLGATMLFGFIYTGLVEYVVGNVFT